jgi:hypothetical protein
MWGSLAIFPFFLTIAYLARVSGDPIHSMESLWTWSIGIALASILVGGIYLSVRAVLVSVAVLLGIFMLLLSNIESGLCAIFCFLAFLNGVSRENIRAWARYSFLFRVFLAIALVTSVLFLRMKFYQTSPSDPTPFFLMMTPWACVPLAWRIEKEVSGAETSSQLSVTDILSNDFWDRPPDDQDPTRRGGILGALVLSPVFLITAQVLAPKESGIGENCFWQWIMTGPLVLVGALFGFARSARWVLRIASAIFSLVLLMLACGIDGGWVSRLGVWLCVCCSGWAFCLLVYSWPQWTFPHSNRLFRLLQVNALTATTLLGNAIKGEIDIISLLFLVFLLTLPLWASVALAWCLRRDLCTSSENPKDAIAQDPQTNSPHDATDTFPTS